MIIKQLNFYFWQQYTFFEKSLVAFKNFIYLCGVIIKQKDNMTVDLNHAQAGLLKDLLEKALEMGDVKPRAAQNLIRTLTWKSTTDYHMKTLKYISYITTRRMGYNWVADYDVRMSTWGSGDIAGKILNPRDHYCAEIKIKVLKPQLRKRIVDFIEKHDWSKESVGGNIPAQKLTAIIEAYADRIVNGR